MAFLSQSVSQLLTVRFKNSL